MYITHIIAQKGQVPHYIKPKHVRHFKDIVI